MFKHQGNSRTLKHNLQLATILSLVAGIVNVCGFLAFQQLTTNVTGHFALFIYDVANTDFLKGVTFFAFILSFFLGSFTSSLLIERFFDNKKMNVYVLPTLLECTLIVTVVILFNSSGLRNPNLIACLLLFAMGLQNSYVTKISNAVVRTTHLTGLFTDLGIELSQLFFPKRHPDRAIIRSKIKLRIYIITSFFVGGLLGGCLYVQLDFQLNALLAAIIILLVGLLYDDFKGRILKTRKNSHKGKHPKSARQVN